MSAWDVRYARQFAEQLADLPGATYDRVEGSVDILASNPGLARQYDPQYEAARPPVPCRSYPVPRTTKVIYLVTDEERRELTMLFLGAVMSPVSFGRVLKPFVDHHVDHQSDHQMTTSAKTEAVEDVTGRGTCG